MTMSPLALVFLISLQVVYTHCFFFTNKERELLYFSGYEGLRELNEAEAVCKSIGANLISNKDDITPLANDLKADGPGVWLNRVMSWECRARTTCCGNYAFLKTTRILLVPVGVKLVVEQRPCSTRGYTLCRIDHDLSQTLNVLYSLQYSSSRLKEFDARRDEYLAEINRLHHEHDVSAAHAETILSQLDSSLQTPKLALEEYYGNLHRDSITELEWTLDADMNTTYDSIASKIKEHSVSKDEDEFLSLFTEVDAAAAAASDSFVRADAAVSTAFVNLKQRTIDSKTRLLDQKSELEASLTHMNDEGGKLGLTLDRASDIERIHDHAEDLVSKIGAEVSHRIISMQPFEVWATNMNESIENLVSHIGETDVHTIPDLQMPGGREEGKLLNNSLAAYEAAGKLDLSFKTTSYILMALLMLVVMANTFLIWREKAEVNSVFERIHDDL